MASRPASATASFPRTTERGLAATPLRPAQGFSRLACLTHPHALALTICALALLLGVAVVDDYGHWWDTRLQRAIGEATLQHLAGENGLNLLWPPQNRLYGPIFEAPLALVERLLGHLGHGDSLRYLLTHLFFVAAGFTGYLLALRLFGNRWLAIFALLLFLLHPRIYAHSFLNSKDVPFLAMFMICLWLAHRAFVRSDSSGSSGSPGSRSSPSNGAIKAFALCGVAAGLLINLRIMGLAFVAVIVFVRLWDAIGADTWDQRKRTIAGCMVFALTAAAVYYVTMPYLWADPLLRFVEIIEVFSKHPTNRPQLFQGELVLASELPRSFLLVWFGITTPPLAILLGAVGLAALVWRVAALRRGSAHTALRFELLVAACFVLPVLTAIVLQPTFYDGWRHFYFLWAPFVLLATSGLRVLVEGVGNGSRPSYRLLPSRLSAAVAAALAALGLAVTAVEMVRLSPHQHLYFNALVDRPGTVAPVYQRFQFHVLFGTSPRVHVLEAHLDSGGNPDAIINVNPHALKRYQRRRHGERDRRRFEHDPNADFDFYVMDRGTVEETLFPPLLYERRLYGKPIVQVATPDLSRVDEVTAESYRGVYRQITSGAPSLKGPDVDVHVGETQVLWAIEPCPPGGVNKMMRMTVVPLDAAQGTRQSSRAYGVRVGDACLWQAPLPDYPIAKMLFPYVGTLATDAHVEELRRRYRALTGPPAARSTFDVYLEDRTMRYLKTPCFQQDADAPFFVHVWPVYVGHLPHSRRRHGFDTLDFRFGDFDPQWNYIPSDIFDGVCMATLELPTYPIASVTTGQYAPGGAGLWQVEIAVADG